MKIAVQLSGGKDSIACLHLARTQGHEVIAIFGNPGNPYPHVIEYIEKICKEWRVELHYAVPEISVLDYIDCEGLPVDILPIWASHEADYFSSLKKGYQVKMQSGITCCSKNLWLPIHQKAKELNPDEVWRGSKLSDDHVTKGDRFEFDGLKFNCPLWNWTDKDVYQYLELHDIDLPLQYKEGITHSLDCIECTSWLDGESELGRAQFTRKHYPIEFERLKTKLALIEMETINQINKSYPFFQECINHG
jgi:3'-phosphoadenosine 5'-phosphosulfate sulfotransferase (PAPS reductase)/FAD synthetase